jgi:probable rRNA maturation factor
VRVAVTNRTRCRLPGGKLLAEAAGLALVRLRGRARGRGLATSLVCVGGRRMGQLNRRFAGRAGLTDVLSFPCGELDPDDGRFHVGDVVICSEAARRESAARGLSLRGELLLYALHGWLHLAGYRDGTAREKCEMLRAEKRIMKRLGLRRD